MASEEVHSSSIYHVNEVSNTASDRDASFLKLPPPSMPFLGAKFPKGCSPVKGKGDDCKVAEWLVLQGSVISLQRLTLTCLVVPGCRTLMSA